MHGKGERQRAAIHISFHIGKGRVRHVDNSSCRPWYKDKQLKLTGWLSWHASPLATPQLDSPWPAAYSKGPLFTPGKTGSGRRKTGRCNEVFWTRLPSKRRGGQPGATLCALGRTFPLAGCTGMEHCSMPVFCPPVMTGMRSQPGQNKSTGPVLGNYCRVTTRALTGSSQKGCPRGGTGA
jgi:hypothetical protein